jgi:probable HAF family extracellular repeat protein
MKTISVVLFLCVFAAALTAGMSRTVERPFQQSHYFTALGDLPGGADISVASGVSADGSVVIGYSNSAAGEEAFRWTRCGGMVGLGFPQALATSDDGSAVAGFRCIVDGTEPVLWTQNGKPQGLGNVAGCNYGMVRGINQDGSMIVGSCTSRSGSEVAFCWTPTNGMARLEPFPNGIVGAEAYAVSDDGEVVVGTVEHEHRRSTAFRWTSQSGLVDLGNLPGDAESLAHAVSADGLVVVGVSLLSNKAFRWTRETGMVDLGTLPGGGRSCAFGVNANGSIIVGQSDGNFGAEAFVWDADHGMRNLRDLLLRESQTAECLHRWKLRLAMAVSRDGSIIVGCGINPSGNREAWIAQLGERTFAVAPTLRVAAR